MNENGDLLISEATKGDLLTEVIPKYGKVAMLFYIPESAKDREAIVKSILENGGNIVKFHECFTYQLGPPEWNTEAEYFPAEVYSTKWITDSIERGEIIEKSSYILSKEGAGLAYPFDKKKIQYTIREIIIIYNWISGRKSQASRKTWESLGNDGVLYCRSRESLKNFWKKWRKDTLDECLDKMLVKDTRYCHNYRDPIMPHEEIPEKRKKNSLKRTKEELVALSLQAPIAEDTSANEETSGKKRIFKRKLKKKASEGAKSLNAESAGVDEFEDLKPIMMCENYEESEEPQKKEDEKENFAINGATNDKSESNELKKPDTPLELEPEKADDLSSISGFPNMGDESEEE